MAKLESYDTILTIKTYSLKKEVESRSL